MAKCSRSVLNSRPHSVPQATGCCCLSVPATSSPPTMNVNIIYHILRRSCCCCWLLLLLQLPLSLGMCLIGTANRSSARIHVYFGNGQIKFNHLSYYKIGRSDSVVLLRHRSGQSRPPVPRLVRWYGNVPANFLADRSPPQLHVARESVIILIAIRLEVVVPVPIPNSRQARHKSVCLFYLIESNYMRLHRPAMTNHPSIRP